MKHAFLLVFLISVVSGTAGAQVPERIDFARDVQPLLKQYCIGCHGPAQQMNGFRLDRRSSALKGGLRVVIVPGHGDVSRLYIKLQGKGYGLQMPPTGALSAEQIEIFKRWIDQGATWPDEFSGEQTSPPADARVAQIMEALRTVNRGRFDAILKDNPEVVRARGTSGTTALMYAALYGDVASLKRLLDIGADPNIRNHAGVSPLMYAANDVEKTRLLLDRGANINDRSDDGRTALLVATSLAGNAPVVRLLLDRGANPTTRVGNDPIALDQAALVGDLEIIQLLIARGADPKAAPPSSLINSVKSECMGCFDIFIKAASPQALGAALAGVAAFAPASVVQTLLDQGANVNAKDPDGRTPVMLAAYSDFIRTDTVRLLIDRGADVNVKGPQGETPLTLALLRGNTTIVEMLRKAGAEEIGSAGLPSPKRPPGVVSKDARDALRKAIPLLQKVDVTFIEKTGCASCHNNSATSMTLQAARTKRFPIDEGSVRQQMSLIASYIDARREGAFQGKAVDGGGPDTISYILLGLGAAGYRGDAATDSMAAYLRSTQLADGRWWTRGHRPPIQFNDITSTATAMRALQLYGPPAWRADFDKRIQRAAAWLRGARAQTTEERAFQLRGLIWAKSDRTAIERLSAGLAAEQKPDGGWSQVSGIASDAYATGIALVALQESGMATSNPVFQRGVAFLLGSQLEDGSWHVPTRALPIQPYFETGFPHGRDQWVSTAGTNWAALALALSLR